MIRAVISIALLLALTAPARAAWSGSAWPSWEWPRSGWTRAQDMYGATLERVNIAGLSSSVTQPVYRLHRNQLGVLTSAYKKRIVECVPYYVNMTLADANGTFSNYLASTGSSDLPMWTWTGLCDYVKAPTNWHLYTPWRELSGLGSNGTNANNFDGVGHLYGESNTATMAGGPYLPPGRTNWYTTDYGDALFTNIVAQLYAVRYLHDSELYNGGTFAATNSWQCYTNITGAGVPYTNAAATWSAFYLNPTNWTSKVQAPPVFANDLRTGPGFPSRMECYGFLSEYAASNRLTYGDYEFQLYSGASKLVFADVFHDYLGGGAYSEDQVIWIEAKIGQNTNSLWVIAGYSPTNIPSITVPSAFTNGNDYREYVGIDNYRTYALWIYSGLNYP